MQTNHMAKEQTKTSYIPKITFTSLLTSLQHNPVKTRKQMHFYLFGSSDQTNNGSEISESNAANCKCRK
jgi:hypothetical protein